MHDTPPEIEERLREHYARLTPSERLRLVGSMYDAALTLMKAGIRQQHPEITESDLRGELFKRLHGDDFTPEEIVRIIAYINPAQ